MRAAIFAFIPLFNLGIQCSFELQHVEVLLRVDEVIGEVDQ